MILEYTLEDRTLSLIPILGEPLYYSLETHTAFQLVTNGKDEKQRRTLCRFKTEKGLRVFALRYGFDLRERMEDSIGVFYVSDKVKKYFRDYIGAGKYEILDVEECIA